MIINPISKYLGPIQPVPRQKELRTHSKKNVIDFKTEISYSTRKLLTIFIQKVKIPSETKDLYKSLVRLMNVFLVGAPQNFIPQMYCRSRPTRISEDFSYTHDWDPYWSILTSLIFLYKLRKNVEPHFLFIIFWLKSLSYHVMDLTQSDTTRDI